MEMLKERILRDGKCLEGGILKVDSFINHQMDPVLMEAMAGEFVRRFAGCGVNENNIGRLRSVTGLNEFHFSARTKVRSNMEYINTQVYMGSKDADEASIDITSTERVRQTIKACLE